MEFPFENTYYTDVDMDELNLIDEEILKIAEFKKQILENPKNYELFDDIPSLNVTKIAVSPSLYAISFILSGNISTGTFDPNKSAMLTTFSTLSNCLNLSSNFL